MVNVLTSMAKLGYHPPDLLTAVADCLAVTLPSHVPNDAQGGFDHRFDSTSQGRLWAPPPKAITGEWLPFYYTALMWAYTKASVRDVHVLQAHLYRMLSTAFVTRLPEAHARDMVTFLWCAASAPRLDSIGLPHVIRVASRLEEVAEQHVRQHDVHKDGWDGSWATEPSSLHSSATSPCTAKHPTNDPFVTIYKETPEVGPPKSSREK